MRALGKKIWVVAGGRIPLGSSGPEPELTSFDQLCLLNTGPKAATVELTVFFSDREPLGPFPLEVPARRTRHVRFNDLIDPQALPLETDYACVISSTVPLVVQFNRQDTRQAANAISSAPAYPVE